MANPCFIQLWSLPSSKNPYCSPNTKSDPKLVKSRNPTALSPNHSKAWNPAFHLKMIKPNMTCRNMPENTVCHDTWKEKWHLISTDTLSPPIELLNKQEETRSLTKVHSKIQTNFIRGFWWNPTKKCIHEYSS